MDYVCERGAKRTTEPWRRPDEEETDEQRLDRLEREQAAALEEEERNAMAELEAKTEDAKREMAVADALDEIRTRNARLQRADRDAAELFAVARPAAEEERERQDREDEEAARKAFAWARAQEELEEPMEETDGWSATETVDSNGSTDKVMSPAGPAPSAAATTDMPPPPSFKRQVKKKKDHSALLGIKKKPSLV